jgi:4-hydroxy-tetrahydrodipicolinate synthase
MIPSDSHPLPSDPDLAHAGLLQGVLAPVVTPFKTDLSPDPARFVKHCTWLLTHGCSGLAVFGTNSEANSLSTSERMELLEGLIHAGLDPGRLLPGTGCCAVPDTVALTIQATRLGCAGVLMLPPFYYKGVAEEGLFRSFSEVVQRVADSRLRIYLYNIPQVAQVAITRGLVERLLTAYPGIVAGVKDSSGDWDNTRAMLEFAADGFQVFVGSEMFLLENLRQGGVGCITAGANVNPGPIDQVYRQFQDPGAPALQAGIDRIRAILQRRGPLIPALKAVLARYSRDPAWRTVRPPQVEMESDRENLLFADLEAAGFSMPGI